MNQQDLYPWTADTRSEKQIDLTKKLSLALSELNQRRLQQGHIPSAQSKKSNRSDYLFVYFPGMPVQVKFGELESIKNIGIKGETVFIFPDGFDPHQPQPELTEQRLQWARLEKQAERAHLKLKNYPNKPMVLLSHCWGTNLMSAFLKLYRSEYQSRVVGMIMLSPHSVTLHPHFKPIIDWSSEQTTEYLIANADQLFEAHKQSYAMMGRNAYPSKYSFASVAVACGQGLGIFETTLFSRMLPGVLKCFIYGEKDQILVDFLIHEMPIYYCHKRKLPEQYEKKVRECLARRGVKTDNVQERFIYRLKGGRHSHHLQPHLHPNLTQIVDDYLSIIEEIN